MSLFTSRNQAFLLDPSQEQLMDKGKAITAEILKDLVLGKATSEKTLVKVSREHNTRMEMLIGIEYVAATLSRYETTLNHLKAFIRWKFKKDDIALEELNYVL